MPNSSAAIRLELHSENKRRNSRISSPCLGVLLAGYQKASLRKAPWSFRWYRPTALQNRPACETATMLAAHFLCALGVLQITPYLSEDLYGLPLTVQEITSLTSLALAVVTSSVTLAPVYILRPDALLL